MNIITLLFIILLFIEKVTDVFCEKLYIVLYIYTHRRRRSESSLL